QDGIVTVERLLAIRRPAERPHHETVINIQRSFERVAQGDMVILIRDPVTFGSHPEIVYESRRGATDHRVRQEVAHARGDSVVLIEVFHVDEPEKLVLNKRSTQGAAE